MSRDSARALSCVLLLCTYTCRHPERIKANLTRDITRVLSSLLRNLMLATFSVQLRRDRIKRKSVSYLKKSSGLILRAFRQIRGGRYYCFVHFWGFSVLTSAVKVFYHGTIFCFLLHICQNIFYETLFIFFSLLNRFFPKFPLANLQLKSPFSINTQALNFC